MATDILKEFLVSIGYKEDQTARKKVMEGITGMTTAVVRLGTVIEATALAVSIGVARWAASLENLYFASQRTGSTADRLQAYGLAARNFGASVEEAQGSVEALAAFLRNNPGGQNLLAGWLGRVGLSARDANGQFLTGVNLMAQLGKMFAIERQQGQWFLANQQAQQFGISDRTALAISSPGFAEELAAQEKRAAGWQKTAEAAHRFEIQLQNLKMQFYQMMLGFEGPAMAALQRIMTSFSRLMRDHGAQAIRDLTRAFENLIAGMGKLLDWLDTHGDEIQKRITQIFAKFSEAYGIAKPALDFLYDTFVKLDKITGGWSTNLAAVLLALRALGATGIISGIAALGVGLAKALGSVAGVVGAGAEWAAAGTAFGSAAALAIAGAIGVGLGWVIDKIAPKKAVDWVGEKGADAIDAFMRAVHFANDAAAHDPGALYGNLWARALPGGTTTNNFTVHNDVTVHGNVDPHRVGGAIADATEDRMRRLNADLIREFTATVR